MESFKKACEVVGTWDDKTKTCKCKNSGKDAVEEADGSFSCEIVLPVVEVTAKPEKEKCRNEDGSKQSTFKCHTGLWILAGIAALFLLLRRGGKKPNNPSGEGGSGNNGGSNGGIRTTTTTLPTTPITPWRSTPVRPSQPAQSTQ